VDSTIEPGVNMSFTPADHKLYKKLEPLQSGIAASAAGPAPNTGILVCNGQQEGAESSKRENFIDTPNPTPLKASHLHRSRFTVGGPSIYLSIYRN